ncbi:MAG: VWA domain-containing protein [Planctomycetota bacterium]
MKLFEFNDPSAASVGLDLFGDYAVSDPLFLTAIPLALALMVHGRVRSGRPHLRMPATGVGRPPRSARQQLALCLPVFRALALVLFCVALARPLRTDVRSTEVTEGVDILTLLDRSSSMLNEDMERGRTRLEVAREVLGEFARRRMTDRVDAADSVGLIAFAGYPDLVCPITLDSEAFADFLATVQHAQPRSDEDGTAIGAALAKAVVLLGESEAKSRVAVLLTDGENTIWSVTPEEAGALAEEKGIVVHTIFVGSGSRTPFGRTVAVDTSELERIAERTGGRFWRAREREQLEQVYAAIEELEKTPRERLDEVETYDLYPPFLFGGLLAYLVAWVGALTVGRRLP